MDPAVLCLGGPDERLRRHAGDVDARTTQRAVFCHRHACAEIGSPNRRRKTRRATPHDQEVKRRLGHWPPPGAFVVSVRIVAPKPVSFVRCAAICAGLTCRGSYRTTPRLSSNVTLALYTPFSRFNASRAVVGQLPHVIFEMCSRTVAVSGACGATCTDCAPAVWRPAMHKGQRTAAPPTPAAKSNVTFNDDNMVNLLTQNEFRPPGEREQRDRDHGRNPQGPLHPAAGNRRGTQGAGHARPLLLTAKLDKAEAERQHGTRDEIGP